MISGTILCFSSLSECLISDEQGQNMSRWIFLCVLDLVCVSGNAVFLMDIISGTFRCASISDEQGQNMSRWIFVCVLDLVCVSGNAVFPIDIISGTFQCFRSGGVCLSNCYYRWIWQVEPFCVGVVSLVCVRVDHYCWIWPVDTFCGCFKSGVCLLEWIITAEYDPWTLSVGVLNLVCVC